MAAGDGRYVKLLARERYGFIAGYHDVPSAGVESRFSSSNVETTISYLKSRSHLIAQKNPFVLGRLHKRCGGAALWIPRKPNCNDFFTEVFVDDKDFSKGLPACVVGVGRSIMNKNVPIVKLCAVRSKDETVNEFILTLCVSHVIGGAHMMYRLWGMLNEDIEVKELIIDRVFNYNGNQVTGMRGAALRKFFWFVLLSKASPLTRHRRWNRQQNDQSVYHFCYLDSKWIEDQKKAHDKSTPGAPYLSTQDIVTPWFGRQVETAGVVFPCDVHSRAKDKGLTPDHVGNYVDALVLFPKEYCDPINIRRAVLSQGKQVPRKNKPGSKNPRSIASISGWHSQYVDLQLPLSERSNHSPLRGAFTLKETPMMVIFKTSGTQYAMWSRTFEEFQDKSPLSEDIVL